MKKTIKHIPETIKIDCGWYGELEFSKFELKKLRDQIDIKLWRTRTK